MNHPQIVIASFTGTIYCASLARTTRLDNDMPEQHLSIFNFEDEDVAKKIYKVMKLSLIHI